MAKYILRGFGERLEIEAPEVPRVGELIELEGTIKHRGSYKVAEIVHYIDRNKEGNLEAGLPNVFVITEP